VHHHGAGLRKILTADRVTAEDQQVIVSGLQSTPITTQHLSASERALLAYADVLTLAPQTVSRAHIDALRAVGYDDRAIHDACAIVSYFAFVNRIADGLGVELET
jgi:alkylhydroperoxidase family enzyme